MKKTCVFLMMGSVVSGTFAMQRIRGSHRELLEHRSNTIAFLATALVALAHERAEIFNVGDAADDVKPRSMLFGAYQEKLQDLQRRVDELVAHRWFVPSFELTGLGLAITELKKWKKDVHDVLVTVARSDVKHAFMVAPLYLDTWELLPSQTIECARVTSDEALETIYDVYDKACAQADALGCCDRWDPCTIM